jgi:hypothetical protein
MKLKLFRKYLEKLTCHFPSYHLTDNAGSVRFLFKGFHIVEMIDSLAENFKMGFSYVHGHATNIRDFENPFSVEVSGPSEKSKFELSELNYGRSQ